MGHAYGVCVIFVTFITTNMVALVAILVWCRHPALVFVIWLPLVTLDGLYLTSALTKVPDGAWFTLLLAVILASFFTLWRYGKEAQWTCEARERYELPDVIVKSAETGGAVLSDGFGGGELSEVSGLGIFFDKAGAYVPQVYEQWLRKFHAQPEVVVLMHLRALSVPHIADEDRFAVARTGVANVYRLTVRHGYGDHVITPDLARLVYGKIREAILSSVVRSSAMTERRQAEHADDHIDAAVSARLRRLDGAFATQSLFLMGKEKLRITKRNGAARRVLLGIFLWVRENCRNRIENLNVPVDKLVEVGFVGEI